MTGGPRIIPIEQNQPAMGPDEGVAIAEGFDASADGEAWLEEPVEHRAPAGADRWVVALVSFALAAWTGFFGWANADAILAGGTPQQWSQWIVNWSIPALLCLVVLLVAMRTSRREAGRFIDVARSLGEQSQRLEERLRTVNSELSLARDFIAAQSRDLESLGRIAADRLSGSASQLAELISDNGKRVDSIATVAQSALENMEKLRGQLPVIANAAKDVTNNIGNAGRTAHVQLENMVAGFQRLNEFGVASERQVQTIRDAVSQAVEELSRQAEQLGDIAQSRLAALASEGEIHRQRLDQDEIAALAAIRARSQALSEELVTHRTAAEASETAAIDSLRARLASLRDESARVAAEIAAGETTALAAWADRAAIHATSLREALVALDGDHRATVEAANARLASFAAQAEALTARLRGELDGLESEIAARLVASDKEAEDRTVSLRDRLARIDAEIGQRREAGAALLNQSADQLAARLAELEQLVARHQHNQIARANEVSEQCARIGERVASFTALVSQASVHGEDAGRAVETALQRLNEQLVASRDTLAGTDRQVADMTDASVRLLELIQASSEHARVHIPAALGTAENGLDGIEQRVLALRETLAEAGDSGRALAQEVLSSRSEAGAAMADIARLQDEIASRSLAQQERIGALRSGLVDLRAASQSLGAEVEASLTQAIAQLTEAARKAGDEIGHGADKRIAGLAAKLGRDSKAAVAGVVEEQAAEIAAMVERAVSRAADKGRETSLQLRDQLAKVDELAGNLENRVARARERAQEQVDSDFARRVALITESLNSTAIDITKVLSIDVADTSWAAYMRGDRGIFTRRAVSLLDSGEAKAVLHHYERNREFREHVNHYIHDFEAMLRQLLSTRDGNALGVTLLSSDMGKLYVALAQAIERLRN